MEIGLFILLLMIFVLPLTLKIVENNLEIFLFIIGVLAMLISNSFSNNFFTETFENKFIYMITAAVLVGGFLFRAINHHLVKAVESILKHMHIKIFVFIMIVLIGMVSSVITAIIASLILVEIIDVLPVSRNNKIKINILACFSIGLGAVLTPIGEPLSTIIVSKLDVGFWYIVDTLGIYIIPGIVAFGLLGTFFAVKEDKPEDYVELEQESNKEIIVKAAKVFLFVIALEMLGTGFKTIVDNYIIELSSPILFWINMSSAILDNATLAAAEISIKMSTQQINSIIIGLLVSGGMMVPGNIPNIISAGKLKIKSSEWMKFGVPVGLIFMGIYFCVFFFI